MKLVLEDGTEAVGSGFAAGTAVAGEDVFNSGIYDAYGRPDGYLIRRRAVDAGIPLIRDLQLVRAIIEALRWRRPESLPVVAWNDYLNRAPRRRLLWFVGLDADLVVLARPMSLQHFIHLSR